MKKVAILGGGASGVVCGAEIAKENKGVQVTIFERLPKLCKKILVTGNGRCNFTNTDLSPSHFYGDYDFLKAILTSVYADTENYFRSIGVMPYFEDGRVYPRSQQSNSIRDALLSQLNKDNVCIKTDFEISDISKNKNGYCCNGEFFDAVVVCGGGTASSVHGSNGSCYGLLKELNHTVTPVYPALCGLVAKEKFINSIKGVRVECKAELYSDNTLLGKERGEVQFANESVSGIPVMNLSHLCKNNKNLSLRLDICHDVDRKELEEHFYLLKGSSPETTVECALSGICNGKLGYVIIKNAGIGQGATLGNLKQRDIDNIIAELKCFTVKIDRTKDFKDAQITCGGLSTTEFNPKTMMSKINQGLFACGEVLDIHGDCGGYNLHLAFTTGRIAAYGIKEYLKG